MSKTRDLGNITNVIKVDATGNVSFVSGSTTLATISTSGQMSGSVPALSSSYALSASYVTNAETLDGLDSTVFTLTSSFNTTSASLYTVSSSAYATSGSLSATSGSFNTRVTALEITGSALSSSILSVSASSYSTSGSLSSASGSFDTRISTVESKYATTGSNTFTAPQYVTDTTVPVGFANSTGSIYTDGGLLVAKDSYFSGSMFIKGNLTIYGTQSVAYITSSQLNIATNVITVNTATPSVRFGGLNVYDSGSTGTGATGSLFWDSQNNGWVYQRESGSTYSGGMLISGPRRGLGTNLGDEQGTTACMVMVGQGGDHITSSLIYHDSSVTCIPNSLVLGTNNAYALYFRDSAGNAKPVMATAGNTNLNFYNVCSTGQIQFRNAADNAVITTIDNLGAACFANTITGTTIYGSTIICSPVGKFPTCLTFGDWTTAANVLLSNKPNEQGAYIRAAVSTAEYPTYAFEDDRDTGMYRDSANSLAFATSGSSRIQISATGDSLFNGTIAIQGACSSRICLIKAYSGSPSNPGFVITDTNGTPTFNHNANGGGTNISGITCIGSNFCVAGASYFAGNVSIGTTSNLTSGNYSSIRLGTIANWWAGNGVSSGDFYLQGNSYYNGSSLRYIRTDAATEYSQVSGVHAWSTATSGTAGCSITMVERMRISNTGLVGIGTINPDYNLVICCSGQVIANVRTNSTTGGSEAGLLITTPDSIGLLTVGASDTRGLFDACRCDMVMGLRTGGKIRFSTDVNANTTQVSIANGITCFACQICAPKGYFGFTDTNWSLGASNLYVSGQTYMTNQLQLTDKLIQTNNTVSNYFLGNLGVGCNSPGVSLTIGSTDAVKLPVGTTAQRPTAATGMVRFNSSCTELEYYNGNDWLFFTSTPESQGYYADVLVVGGGGGGGGAEASNGFGGGGAGGGAGGYMAGRIFINYTNCGYPISIGGGGTGGANEGQSTGSGCNGTMGTASCALGLVAIGGGFGAGDETQTGGGNGGSGGGNGGDNTGIQGCGTLGQGCAGGYANTRLGGGGGGASTTGCHGYGGSGAGGQGRAWYNGTTYAGGGGGGAGSAVTSTQSGGAGGGGNGSSTNGTSGAFQSGGTATAGTANTGGGGGAGAAGRAQGGQNGGSGIVIVRYYGSQKGFGGTITSSGGYTYHSFTSSGTYCATYY